MIKSPFIRPVRSGNSVLLQFQGCAGHLYLSAPASVAPEVPTSLSEFKPSGCNEDSLFALFNDYLISVLYGCRNSLLCAPSDLSIRNAFKENISVMCLNRFRMILMSKPYLFPLR